MRIMYIEVLISQCKLKTAGLGIFKETMTSMLSVTTVDVNKMFTKSFTDHVSIIFHQIRKHELVTSVGGLQCLMLTSCKICKFVDYHVDGGR